MKLIHVVFISYDFAYSLIYQTYGHMLHALKFVHGWESRRCCHQPSYLQSVDHGGAFLIQRRSWRAGQEDAAFACGRRRTRKNCDIYDIKIIFNVYGVVLTCTFPVRFHVGYCSEHSTLSAQTFSNSIGIAATTGGICISSSHSFIRFNAARARLEVFVQACKCNHEATANSFGLRSAFLFQMAFKKWTVRSLNPML